MVQKGERDPLRCGRSTQQRSVPLASLWSARSRRGLDGPLESGREEMPNWDCAAEARGEDRVSASLTLLRDNFSDAMRRKPLNHYNVSQKESSLSRCLRDTPRSTGGTVPSLHWRGVYASRRLSAHR